MYNIVRGKGSKLAKYFIALYMYRAAPLALLNSIILQRYSETIGLCF